MTLAKKTCELFCREPSPAKLRSNVFTCLCLVPRASCLCLVPLPRASASCLVPGVRTSAPNRVVRHELKTTAQCSASLPTAPRAHTAAARAARAVQRRQGSAKKRKDPGLISGQQHRPPDYIEQSRPVLKAHQEVPRPPHEDGPRATQRRRPTARSAQQMTRLPPSRAGEHTGGRTRTVFQDCDATMCTSTRRGREKTAQGARAQRRRPPTRTDDPTARRLGVAAADADADRRPGPRCRCKPHPPPRPSATIKTPETHKTRPSDKNAGRPRSTLVAAKR